MPATEETVTEARGRPSRVRWWRRAELAPRGGARRRPGEARAIVHRLVRKRAAMSGLVVLLLVVCACLAAPLYAHHIAHDNAFVSNPGGHIVVHGRTVSVLEPGKGGLGVIPIGPTWTTKYFLGADSQGRDVMARLLYGGRTSLAIGFAAAVICSILALVIALAAGWLGGLVDTVLSRLMDLVWAFPVYLVAISLATVLQTGRVSLGPVTLSPGSLWVPIGIIGIIYVPYLVRPLRGRVLTIVSSDYVEAARAQGAGSLRIIWSDVLPNVLDTVIVLFPIILATNILTESGLSFLGIGVQAPNASWGTIIGDGESLIYSRPLVSIVPGAAIAIAVLALNLFGDGLRDALDPRSQVRI